MIAELADDPDWPEVTPTEPGDADLLDLGTGLRHVVPRAFGFRGDALLQIREPDSPGFMLSPAVVPVHDPALITHARRAATSGTTTRASPTSRSRRSGR